LLSKSQIKLITSLQQKKYRDKHGLFVAEGPKIIKELLNASFEIHSLFSIDDLGFDSIQQHQIDQADLKRISFLKNANTALAVFHIPEKKITAKSGVIVALDAIRDPGNIGTIIRLCDWFGIEHLICSKDTADSYNPKVIQAAMGSTARVHIEYLDLDQFLEEINLPVYGGCLNGESVYKQQFPEDMIIVLGNEANGISNTILDKLTKKITIPQFGKLQETESLNVATATAILLNEIRRGN
jgi:TrmH family RNA methyltransferase